MQEKVKIQNSIGKNISAVIHRPEAKTEKLAILCPGFLDSKDYNGLLYLAEVLSENGFTAVRFDPTGTWESEGDISDYSMTQYLKDVRSVKEYMLKNGEYNYILLAGHSRGGRVSLLYATQDSDISMVVGIMPSATSIPRGPDKQRNNDQWKKEGTQISTRDIPGNGKERKQFPVPYSFLEDSLKYNVMEEIPKMHIPVLLLAGEKDTIIYPDEVKSIFDKLACPKEFIIVSGVGHDYRHNIEKVKRVNDIIIKHLNNMEEYIDIINKETGEKTGVSKPKTEVHQNGLWHRTAHVWCINSKGEILLQRRAVDKQNFPDMWDISAAGHISADEEPVVAALRETKEEIGLDIPPEDLKFLGTTIQQFVLNNGTYIDNEYQNVYLVKINAGIDELHLQKEELKALEWIKISEFEK